jgi:hypothetical protein
LIFFAIIAVAVGCCIWAGVWCFKRNDRKKNASEVIPEQSVVTVIEMPNAEPTNANAAQADVTGPPATNPAAYPQPPVARVVDTV